ncbi:hypothetical protein APUTEX25_005821 [Auxenochlorella protothecoides]|uniref:NET domain-containing protein n=1 Tax=Auxenochlorella protothecoides TaxID=3075 RepID=A0A3M7L176_AUXPR|nr:hypothetical protein APUTEX25_005821 [Auxenochlorella protothecoides]|eukprot:RMZ55780.1 hypothetical protein APUTEX25_005821 [Auxenochlorella protothecoides]
MGAPLPKGLRMTFRLDDGTTIRSSGEGKATVLKARESFAAGLLSETHLLRVQALLCEVHAKLPDEGPLKTLSLSSKRSAETDVEALDIVSAKRSHSLNGHGPTAETASALPSPQSAAPAPLAPRPIVPPPAYPEPFAGRCLAMVDKVITALGGPKDAAALGFTVAVDAKLVPDYYTIMAGVVDILQRADELPTNEDGEVELDLGVLSPKTVWALYEYVIGPAAGGAPRKAAPGAAGDGAGFQLAEDSDYAPDDDDDD